VKEPKSEPDEPMTAGTPSPRGDETILLVEDEVPLRDLVVRVLGSLGYNVLSAGTAVQALEVLGGAGGKLDLLLTDMVLPGGLQGKNLALDLVASMPNLPVIFMSGYTREPHALARRPGEAVNFLEKPFTPSALARAVRAVLDKARASS
jgi:two-component system cell cycle sensor histidine kinase/response regulator CckA